MKANGVVAWTKNLRTLEPIVKNVIQISIRGNSKMRKEMPARDATVLIIGNRIDSTTITPVSNWKEATKMCLVSSVTK